MEKSDCVCKKKKKTLMQQVQIAVISRWNDQ